MNQYEWQFLTFDQLSVRQLYLILAARQDVFVVEQECPFPEMDRIDDLCYHLVVWADDDVAGYARIVPPGVRLSAPSIGRIITTQAHRGTGLGKMLMERSIEHALSLYPNQDLYLSAQIHLDRFYRAFGFVAFDEPYDEDGIMHQDMVRKFQQHSQ